MQEGSLARKKPLPAIITGLGGLLMVISAFLPWVTVEAGRIPGLSDTSAAGTSKDGKFTLVFGLLLIVAAVLMWVATSPGLRRGIAVAAVVLGIAGALIAIINLASKDSQFEDGIRTGLKGAGQEVTDAQVEQLKAELKRLGFSVSFAVGIYLTAAAGLIAIVGGVVGLAARQPAEPVAVEATPPPPLGSTT